MSNDQSKKIKKPWRHQKRYVSVESNPFKYKQDRDALKKLELAMQKVEQELKRKGEIK